MERLAAAILLWIAFVPPPAGAQELTARPPGPYAVDVRGAVGALPTLGGFFPPVPSGTALPGGGAGLDAGAHVYLFGVGPGRVGVGASVQTLRGRTSPGGAAGTSDVPTRPVVESRFRTVAPQLSLNFGSAAGWSYISAGIGQARIRTAASSFLAESGTGSLPVAAPAGSTDGGSRRSLNVGGGARWFAKSRLAFSFDVRVHLVSAGRDDDLATPGATLVVASAGLSLR